MKNIAIFASGNGTNAESIINYFKESNIARVRIVLTNNANAGVINRSKSLNTNVFVFSRDELYNSDKVLKLIQKNNIDLIVLAGFLWLVPENILDNYKNRIVNIHPALLPDYGGQGMYGMHVHEAVIAASEKQSGITIHKVNKHYDEGQIVFQTEVDIDPQDTPESLAEKIHKLEHMHFPRVIERYLT